MGNTSANSRATKKKQSMSLVAGMSRSAKLAAGWVPITSHTWVQSLEERTDLPPDWDVPKGTKTVAYHLDLSKYCEDHQKDKDGKWISMSALVYDEVCV